MSTMIPGRTPLSVSRQTLRSALADAEVALQRSGVASPRHDAEELAAHLLDTTRSNLWRHLDDQVPVGFVDLTQRRGARVPLQHITGYAHFRHLTLAVGPGVFIPRPETEIVAQFALDWLKKLGQQPPIVVDLCAGSGAIGLALATELADATVVAVENDPGALPWLRRNAAGRVQVVDQDIDGCLPDFSGRVDLVIANPPYIPVDALPRDPEVARYDPELALYSGADGLDHIRTVERTASRLLRPGGLVVVEHADQQGSTAPEVFSRVSTWTEVVDHQDLTGRDRYVSAQLSAPSSVNQEL
ncbi:MAG TPA: peptide chain release factor N(5)-glutamine methyltransferase [Actinomycetes bacterium]|nr:peptide chain release factor N(5)-glutamine methyltransferase [Actinomycetes bacterium]